MAGSGSGSPVDVRLRDVEGGDLEVFFEQQRDPEAVTRAVFPSRERGVFMAHWATTVLGDPSVFTQAVVADGEVAGYVVCWEGSGRWMVGYWFGRRFWDRGIATRALRLFLDGVRVRPLYADPAVSNVGSIRVLEKCGFREVARETGEVEHVVLALET